MESEITANMADVKEAETLEAVRKRINAHKDDSHTIVEELRRGVVSVGQRFEKGEFFLTELIMAGEIFREAMQIVKTRLKGKVATDRLGTIVIGTAQGDIHDIGKNIFATLMEAVGFEVHDLGVDVPPNRFVDAIREFNPQLVGLSTLLSTGLQAVDTTIRVIEAAGLRRRVKILVGGGIAGEKPANETLDADAIINDAFLGVEIAKDLVGAQ